MALQTEVHSSTPTPSSTSSTPDPTNTDSGSMQPGFSLSASPPLILAFLAVGVFGVTIIGFFAWRRLTGHGRWVDPPDIVRPGFGETPKLWDVCCPRETHLAEWHGIQPLAATVWDDTPVHVASVNDIPRHDTLLAAAFTHLRRSYRPRRQSDPEEKLPQNAPSPVRLQVAVTIAMPCPDFAALDPDAPFDYAIGLYETEWKKTDD